jgi:hypothetical protein
VGVTRDRVTDVATVALGVTYVLAGIAESVRVVVTGDGGFVFWFGTLVGGGTAILLGILAFRGRPRVSTSLVLAGSVVGMPATMWTLVVPMVAVTVVVLTLQRTARDVTR